MWRNCGKVNLPKMRDSLLESFGGVSIGDKIRDNAGFLTILSSGSTIDLDFDLQNQLDTTTRGMCKNLCR
jgi:hypothetical protein